MLVLSAFTASTKTQALLLVYRLISNAEQGILMHLPLVSASRCNLSNKEDHTIGWAKGWANTGRDNRGGSAERGIGGSRHPCGQRAYPRQPAMADRRVWHSGIMMGISYWRFRLLSSPI